MIDESDPFTGTWKFNTQQSSLDTPLPRTWVQAIVATTDELVVRETIIRADGSATEVRVWARFDGTDYPLNGLPFVDFIAYQRANRNRISGIGKKNGVVVLNETVTVDEAGKVLTLIYSIQNGTSSLATGMAVFDKSPA